MRAGPASWLTPLGGRAGGDRGPDRDYGITVALNRRTIRRATIEAPTSADLGGQRCGALEVTSAVARSAGASRSLPRIAREQT